MCKVPDCDRAVLARGWCQSHYARWRRYGDVRAAVPLTRPTAKQCSVEACARPAMARTWCWAHYGRWKKTGDVRAAVPIGALPAVCPAGHEFPPGVGTGRVCLTCKRSRGLERYRDKRVALDLVKVTRGCTDCGYRDHPEALEFDHVPGHAKAFNIGQGITRYTLDQLLAEVEKCEVVCANCHRVRTFRRRQCFDTGNLSG